MRFIQVKAPAGFFTRDTKCNLVLPKGKSPGGIFFRLRMESMRNQRVKVPAGF